MTRPIFRIGNMLAACGLLFSCARQLPVLSINPIANRGVIRGVASFSGSATQKSGIRSVTLYVDAKRLTDATKANTGWSARIDASSLVPGVHYVTVMAHANDGTWSQQTVSVVAAQ